MKIDKDWIYVHLSQDEAEKLDAVWVQSKKMYRLPNTLGALRELYKLKPSEELKEYGKRKSSLRSKMLEMKKVSFNATPKRLEGLRPYQKSDVHFIAQLLNVGIFSEQRTGKSVVTLKAIESEGWEKVIIVCPASLVLNWKREVETWTQYEPLLLKGGKKQRLEKYNDFSTQKVLIISYETLRNDIEHLLKIKDKFCLVADEVHRIRNYKSLQSKALFSLGRLAYKRLALTGTPSVNEGSDVFGILHFLYPEKFPSYWQFVERYFKIWKAPWGAREVKGYKRKEELQEILDVISVQRKRSEVMSWIPKKVYQTIEVEMDAKQSKVYKDMLDTFIVEEEGEIKVDAPSVLAQLTRLRQLCLSPDLLGLNAPSAKEKALMEWLDDNPNESVVVFSNFTSYLKRLSEKIEGCVLLHGEMSSEQKQHSVNQIQSGKAKVLLANIISGGTGFTIDKAETVIFLDRDYVPSNNAQAEDRIVPTTEQNNHSCTIIDIVVADTVDSKIQKILKDKKSVTEAINNYRGVVELLGTH